ncbi:hypothetical protein GA0070617_2355 [Micromonospora yangpuensis]|uniref:Uncharacterized protein n=2 Tax=Micromonospora yangpuensis TaxID=683228 RepID=A0A1C6UHE3_9ACTN|nr:hypothetical protein GA0070617_2355 [Micromonospora yangpuensis]
MPEWLASVLMRPSNDRVSTGTAIGSTRSTLTGLAASVGTVGLTEAGLRPALLAVVDQHAAAIRDSLDGDRQPLTPAALAGYAEGLRDAAREAGWPPSSGPVDWAEPDWLLTRLLAVCALARSLPTAPLPPAPA